MDREVLKQVRKSMRRLQQAIAAENVQDLEWLLGSTADVDYKYNGKTASELAFQTGNVNVMDKVFRTGCDLNKIIDDEGNTFLTKAICDGSSDDVLTSLLHNGADPDLPNNSDLTPLHLAASFGRLSAIKILVQRASYLNRCDSSGQTALFKCSSKGYHEIVKLLIETGADIEWTDNERRTPLFAAVETNHFNIVKILIEAGCNVNARDKYGRTPLIFAAKYGFLDLVTYLINNHADMEKFDSRGSTPFSEAVTNLNLDVVKELIKCGCNINSQNFDMKQNAIHKSVCQASNIYGQRENQLKLFRMLIEAGCSINMSDQLGCTPLFCALLRGETELANVLLQNGALTASVNNNRETLLHASVLGHQLELTETFLRSGIEVNCMNLQNETPLYLAVARKSSLKLIQMLINYGSNLNACEKSDLQTPLFVGVINDYKDAVNLLIKSGCDVNIMNSNGYTPLWAACDSKNESMVKSLLCAKNVDVNLGFKCSPIHAAIKNGSLEIVRLLTEAKCDVNKLTDGCQSPICLASEMNHVDVAVLLIQSGADPLIHLNLKRRGKCCLIYHDPHPHLELDPLFGSIENNNLKMAKLLMIASHKLYYDVLTTLKDIVFRTNYAKDARLTQSSLRQYAIFFAHVLSMPRTLKEMARGIIRKQLGLYPKDKIDSLKLPDRVRDYVTLTGLETICSK